MLSGVYIRPPHAHEMHEVGDISFRSYATLFPDGYKGVRFADTAFGTAVKDTKSRLAHCTDILVAVKVLPGCAQTAEGVILGQGGSIYRGDRQEQILGVVDYHANYACHGAPGIGKLAVEPKKRRAGALSSPLRCMLPVCLFLLFSFVATRQIVLLRLANTFLFQDLKNLYSCFISRFAIFLHLVFHTMLYACHNRFKFM